jgi:hypothetical protein
MLVEPQVGHAVMRTAIGPLRRSRRDESALCCVAAQIDVLERFNGNGGDVLPALDRIRRAPALATKAAVGLDRLELVVKYRKCKIIERKTVSIVYEGKDAIVNRVHGRSLTANNLAT